MRAQHPSGVGSAVEYAAVRVVRGGVRAVGCTPGGALAQQVALRPPDLGEYPGAESHYRGVAEQHRREEPVGR